MRGFKKWFAGAVVAVAVAAVVLAGTTTAVAFTIVNPTTLETKTRPFTIMGKGAPPGKTIYIEVYESMYSGGLVVWQGWDVADSNGWFAYEGATFDLYGPAPDGCEVYAYYYDGDNIIYTVSIPFWVQ
jgi:hypothetical protein